MYHLTHLLLVGSLSGLAFLTAGVAQGQGAAGGDAAAESPAAKQARLVRALEAPELTAEKAAAFEELAVWGTAEVIPILAPLLADEQLAHYARFALEANPDPAVDALLRQSLDRLDGKLLIGVINSLGVRRDAQAVSALAARLAHEDVEVASAAAHALGCLATADAVDALTAALATQPAPHRAGIARGCVVCAENCSKAGARDQAVTLYDRVRSADVPAAVRQAALRGAILARGSDGVTLLAEQLRAGEPDAFDVALRAARELPPTEVVPALIDSLDELPPENAAGVILALGDLGDARALGPVAAALQAESPLVRRAALSSLQQIGDATVLPAVWKLAAGPDPQLAEAARATLAALPGHQTDEAIVAELARPDETSRILALELIGRRRIVAAVPQLLQLASGSDGALKTAALRALGETVSLEQVPVLVSAVIAARSDAEKTQAQIALTSACVRMVDRDACARMLTEKLASAPDDAKTILLEQLGAMGGPVALACLADCATDARPDTQDAATRILGTWIGADVGPVLLDLARSINNEKFKIRVLRGYIRIASQFGLPHDEKMDMCTKALAAAQRDEERELVLNVLAADPSPVALRIAVTQLDNAALKTRTAAVAVAIAQIAIQTDPQAVAEAMQAVIRAAVGGETESRAKGYLERAQQLLDIVAQDQDGVTTIERGGQLLLEYRSQPNPMKVYVAQWTTPQGTQLLRDSPADHVHHRALMFAVGIDNCDFWSEEPSHQYGRQVPVQTESTAVTRSDAGGTAVIKQTINWVSPQNEVLAVESREITAHIGVIEAASLLTWATTLRPTPEKPEVTLCGSHYFGLGARFVESMDAGATFLTPGGEAGTTVRGSEKLTRAPWCALRGNADGKPVTIAMFDALGNPRHPATWFTMNDPFAYLSATLDLDTAVGLSKQQLKITRDQPLQVTYGVAAWDGAVDEATIARAYRTWCDLP